MSNEEVVPAAATESAADTVQPGTAQEGGQVTATGAETKVEETEQQKAERIVQERKVREERARKKINARFAELTAQSREKDALIKRLIEERSPPKQQQGNDDPEPERNQFEDFEEWTRASARWAARQEARTVAEAQRKQWEAAHAQQRNAEAMTQIEHGHAQRVAAYAKANPEFAEVLESDVNLEGMAPLYVQLMDDGPAVMLALHKNPELADRINSAHPYMQGVLLGQLSAFLKSRSPQVSKAPAPGKPVSGQSAGASKDLATADYDEYVKQRRAARSR